MSNSETSHFNNPQYTSECEKVTAFKDRKGRIHQTCISCKQANKEYEIADYFEKEMDAYRKVFPEFLDAGSRNIGRGADIVLRRFIKEMLEEGYVIRKNK